MGVRAKQRGDNIHEVEGASGAGNDEPSAPRQRYTYSIGTKSLNSLKCTFEIRMWRQGEGCPRPSKATQTKRIRTFARVSCILIQNPNCTPWD